MVWIQLFLIQLRIWFCTASYFIGWRIAVCVWLWKQTNSSLKWTSVVVASPYFLQGGRFSRATVINGRLKELSVTLLNRGNSSTRSLKTPVVTLFGHFDFTREEPGRVQKRIELWDSFGDRSPCCKVAQESGWKFTIQTHLILTPLRKPSNSDIRHSTDLVHALKDLKWRMCGKLSRILRGINLV